MMRFLSISIAPFVLAGCVAPGSKTADQSVHNDQLDADHRAESSLIERQEVIGRTNGPSLESTARSRSEVMRIALAHAQKLETDFTLYDSPTITQITRNGRKMWLVSWSLKNPRILGGFFSVVVDDQTGVADTLVGF